MTRLAATTKPEVIDFEKRRFVAIQPGSEVRESKGFIPMDPSAELPAYQIGAKRWAFRVRIDKVRPDPTQVKERLRELIAGELEAGAEFVGSKRRKELRDLVEEEILVVTSETSKIIECAIDGDVVHVGTTSRAHVDTVSELLRAVGVVPSPMVPWGDEVMDLSGVKLKPGQSAHGSDFLDSLDGAGRELVIDPEGGHVKIVTPSTTMTLRGDVLVDLGKHPERHILVAKLAVGEQRFKLDGPSWQVRGLSIETGRHEHWTEVLDERLEKINALWDLLGREYDASLERPGAEVDNAEAVRELLVEVGERRDVATVEAWSDHDRSAAATWARDTSSAMLRLPVMPKCLLDASRAAGPSVLEQFSDDDLPAVIKKTVANHEDGITWPGVVSILLSEGYLFEEDDDGMEYAKALMYTMLHIGELDQGEDDLIITSEAVLSSNVHGTLALGIDASEPYNTDIGTALGPAEGVSVLVIPAESSV